MIRQDSILPKKINMATLKNPIEETSSWIIKIVGGVYKEREKPILKKRVQEFFPYTPISLFQDAFTKVLADGKIKESPMEGSRSTGYLKV